MFCLRILKNGLKLKNWKSKKKTRNQVSNYLLAAEGRGTDCRPKPLVWILTSRLTTTNQPEGLRAFHAAAVVHCGCLPFQDQTQ